VGDLAHRHGLKVHLDGARVFNAAVALGVDVRALTRGVDTIGFCLSKGLSAPVGSVLCGDAGFVAEARRWRKVVGGGMRQAGILAAAGVIALEQMVERLAEDHENARRFSVGISGLPGIDLDPDTVATNIVIFGVASGRISAPQLAQALKERGVLMGAIGPSQIRAVTHYGIEATDVQTAVAAIQEIMEQRA
jgi:threonine aldolase